MPSLGVLRRQPLRGSSPPGLRHQAAVEMDHDLAQLQTPANDLVDVRSGGAVEDAVALHVNDMLGHGLHLLVFLGLE